MKNKTARELIQRLEAQRLWNQLTDTGVDEQCNLDEPFLHFPVGTFNQEIWHWFEDTYRLSIEELKRPQKRVRLRELKAIAENLHGKLYHGHYNECTGIEKNVKIYQLKKFSLTDLKEVDSCSIDEPWKEEIAEALIAEWNNEIKQADYEFALQDLINKHIPIPNDDFYRSFHIKETGEEKYFDVRFQLAGRMGGHLLLEKFETDDVEDMIVSFVTEFGVLCKNRFRYDYAESIHWIRDNQEWLIDLDKYYEHTFSKIDATDALYWELLYLMDEQLREKIREKEPEILEARMTPIEKLQRFYYGLVAIFGNEEFEYYPAQGVVRILTDRITKRQIIPICDLKNFEGFEIVPTPWHHNWASDPPKLFLVIKLDFIADEFFIEKSGCAKINLKEFAGVKDG